MALLTSIALSVQHCDATGSGVSFRPFKVIDPETRKPVAAEISEVPQVYWGSGDLWTAGSLWLYERAKLTLSGDLKIRTVHTAGTDLHAYAQWLEALALDWRYFPIKAEERCLVRYRGALVKDRDRGALAASLATRRMSAAVRFYRWVLAQGLLSPGFPLWKDRQVDVRYVDCNGFPRTLSVVSSELAIPFKPPSESIRLEDGAQPVSNAHRDDILRMAKAHASTELYYMLALGFLTGMRLGSLADLKVRTLSSATPVHGTDKVMALSIGPEAKPPVATKFGKSGKGILIPTWLLEELMDYAVSVRRGKRERLAPTRDKDLVFLTVNGGRYAERGVNKSAAVNGEMARLRKVARSHGVDMQRFNFHWTRATFATGWAQVALDAGRGHQFLPVLMEMLLHKDEATTWRYIRYVEKQKVRAELADLFTREMFGLLGRGEAVANA